MQCEQCGGWVDLSSVIDVTIEQGGITSITRMTEYEARDLLVELGIPAPPVLCDKHPEVGPISTEAL